MSPQESGERVEGVLVQNTQVTVDAARHIVPWR